MNNIPTQIENPKGLHQRYVVKKIVPHPKAGQELPGGAGNYGKWHGGFYPDLQIENIDEGAEYFVMRLDTGGSDIEHIKACRIGVNAYADAIEHHLPELAKDLRERYPTI